MTAATTGHALNVDVDLDKPVPCTPTPQTCPDRAAAVWLVRLLHDDEARTVCQTRVLCDRCAARAETEGLRLVGQTHSPFLRLLGLEAVCPLHKKAFAGTSRERL